MGTAAAAAMSGAFGQNPTASSGMFAQTPGGAGTPGAMGSTSTSSFGTPAGQMGNNPSSQPSGTSGGDTLAGKVFGGGPIIGVASTSHKTSIREFNKKNHYNDWYFIYDPSMDRGGLVRGPAQPPIPGTGGAVVGAPGTTGTSPGAPASSGFGNPSMPGFGNSPLQGPGAMIPAQPQAQPQQQ